MFLTVQFLSFIFEAILYFIQLKVLIIFRVEPSKEMKAALKVLNDSLSNSKIKGSRHLTAATNIISQEWITVTSKKEANPKVVEDYLDELEAVSRNVLAKVVNMTDANVS